MDGFLEGANVQELAEPVVTDNQVEESNVEDISTEGEKVLDNSAEGEQPQSPELNAKLAAARREAEEKYRKKEEGINNEFKRLFGNVPNPLTGRNIETYQDYLQAVEYQQREMQNRILSDKGINPTLIEQMVNNSPAMRQAQQILAENTRAEAQRMLDADLRMVMTMAPEIKTMEDLQNHPSFGSVLDYVNSGLSLPNAFKLANYDSLVSRNSDAARQAAINQARSKNHMETTNSVSGGSETHVPIPDGVLAIWKESYPELSMEQLTKKYNDSIN